MMGDTPSNYNIPNGRLDGKSLGLKAILVQAQKHGGTTIDAKGSNSLVNQQPKLSTTPQNALSKVKNSKESEERKFASNMIGGKGNLDKSVDGGQGAIN